MSFFVSCFAVCQISYLATVSLPLLQDFKTYTGVLGISLALSGAQCILLPVTIVLITLNNRAPSAIFTDLETTAISILFFIADILYFIFVVPIIIVLALYYCIYPLSDDLRKFGLIGQCIFLHRFYIYCITIPQYPSATNWKLFCRIKGYPDWADCRR
ncbi:hypothetical protein BDP27DRAFT_1318889 [Rhodocollybia butyracea]|uniref:Uncharacterized protein n=1 Tax=Rhodocollybia butyracea TaxID=206335 RepID=A0A9P5UBT9_9AGAR|nr:hypothetical protein BDP27DRAFT_1318889 [Rhodocollybia butyracea]